MAFAFTGSLFANEVNIFSARHYDSDVQLYEKFTAKTGIKVNVVAGKSGVSSNVPSGRVMMGNPAVKMENNIESYKALRRLPRLVRKIEELQKLLLR